MKKLLTIGVLLLFSVIAIAQQAYIPMLKKDNNWIIYYSFFMDQTEYSVMLDQKKDTTIAGKIYKNIDQLLLREDSSAAKVYIYNHKQQAEGVLYDFKIKVGDTMNYSGFKSSMNCKHILKAIEPYTFDNGVKTTKYIFDRFFWILGMGSNRGLGIEPAFACQSDPSYVVSCFLQKSRKLYGNNTYGLCKTLGSSEIFQENRFDAYINTEDNNTLHIKFYQDTNQDINRCALRIYDILGNVIFQQNILDLDNTILLDYLPQGVYVLHIYENNKLIGVKKVKK